MRYQSGECFTSSRRFVQGGYLNEAQRRHYRFLFNRRRRHHRDVPNGMRKDGGEFALIDKYLSFKLETT